MALDIASKVNTDAPSVMFPYGQIRDNPGDNTGTPVNVETMSDYVQFFAKMMAESNVSYSGFLDSDQDGWDFYNSLRDHIAKFSNVLLKGSSSTLQPNTFGCLVVAFTGSPITLTLPVCPANQTGRKFTIVNPSPVAVTIAPGTNTIFPSPASLILNEGDAVEFVVSSLNNVYILNLYRRDTTTAPATLTNLNSWSGTLKYYKDNFDIVRLKGQGTWIVVGTPLSVIANLPVGFRPTSTKTILINYYNATTTTTTQAFLIIGTNGDITWQNEGSVANGDAVNVYLDDISFYTEW